MFVHEETILNSVRNKKVSCGPQDKDSFVGARENFKKPPFNFTIPMVQDSKIMFVHFDRLPIDFMFLIKSRMAIGTEGD